MDHFTSVQSTGGFQVSEMLQRRPTASRLLSAAILAGGASRRMGTDKALLMLAGQTLLERAISVLAGVADDVIVVGDRPAYHAFGVPVVRDAYPSTGPIGGIATALQFAQHDDVLVVACDMPFLSSQLLFAMADMPRSFDALVPVTEDAINSQRQGRTVQTLHAIYRRSCLRPFQQRIDRREFRLVDGLADVDVQELDEAWIRRYDPDLDSFVNTNNLREWETAIERFNSRSAQPEDQG